MQEKKEFAVSLAGQELKAEFGFLAPQAGGSAKVSHGDTVILATATMSRDRREGMDYFPLFVDYEERYYAAGKIKGSRFIKREGRPSDKAILNGRIIDRTIRPLFNHQMRNEVQVVITVLSIDKKHDPVATAVIAASLALGVSNVPWGGPIAAVRVGQIGDVLKINPTEEDVKDLKLDLLVAGSAEKINMIESGAKEISNRDMVKAIEKGFAEVKNIAEFQNKIIAEIGKEKTQVQLTAPSEEFTSEINTFLEGKNLADAFYTRAKTEKEEKMAAVKDAMKELIEQKYPAETSEEKAIQAQKKSEADLIYEEFLNDVLHKRILEEGERPDGRKAEEIRTITSEAGVLPRTHGSGVFQRGETQALTVATLGAPGDEQIVDTMEEDIKKRYIHHYNFPPYCVGEVRMMRGPGRREIGHGALAEKAIVPVLPDVEDFPYTKLLVSEVLASNGSSSMASTCGSTLALMDAGVPIKRPVSGIAMGIVMGKDGKYEILSDIQGPEDHWGDMDFKVAGTSEGITAMQLDVKIDGITPEIAAEVLEQAFKGRMKIMETMLKAIPEPRKELSPYAPRIITMQIHPDKIREVIGPGGKVINEIIDETGCQIDIEDSGMIFITAEDGEGGQKAQDWIARITKDLEVGDIYDGTVVKIMDFGAFVEVAPGKDGLVHISEIAHERIARVEDKLKVGQEVKVKVKEIDQMGRVNLTIKDLLPRPSAPNFSNQPPRPQGPFNNNRPPRRPHQGRPQQPPRPPQAPPQPPQKEDRGPLGEW